MIKAVLCAGVTAGLLFAAGFASQPTAPRVSRLVLISVDAGSDAALDRLLAAGALKGGAFERIGSRGLVAQSMTPPAVASTPVSHPTLFTGAWPERHGITGVTLPAEDIAGEVRSGFAAATSVDRLWTIAQRAGKRVVCITAPGADATRPDNTCTETLPFAAIGRPQPADSRIPAAADLASRLRRSLGPSPGEPDGRLVTRGEMTEDEYVARAERFADYQGAIVTEELKRKDWDLLIAYMPILDNLEHRYLLLDRRQAEYGEDGGTRRDRFARYIEHGYKKIDAMMSGWFQAAPDTTFVIVSDHGMIPTHSTVLLNNVLAAAGLRVGGPDAEVRALSSGASGQVYVNSRTRFARGVVADEDVQKVIDRVVEALRSVRDTATGSPVFSIVATRAHFAELGLQHPNAGDVYVSAVPGWGVTGRFDPAAPTVVRNTLSPDTRKRISRTPAEDRFLENGALNELSLGVHGHRPADPRLQAWFMAIGPGVPHRRVGVVPMIDVAPTVLSLLGVPIPPTVSGHAIW